MGLSKSQAKLYDKLRVSQLPYPIEAKKDDSDMIHEVNIILYPKDVQDI